MIPVTQVAVGLNGGQAQISMVALGAVAVFAQMELEGLELHIDQCRSVADKMRLERSIRASVVQNEEWRMGR
jgi:hypothetical protein